MIGVRRVPPNLVKKKSKIPSPQGSRDRSNDGGAWGKNDTKSTFGDTSRGEVRTRGEGSVRTHSLERRGRRVNGMVGSS